MRRGIAVVLGALVLLVAAPVDAQRRGGRFGGSRGFRSSSSSRSFGSRSRSRSRSVGSRSRSRSRSFGSRSRSIGVGATTGTSTGSTRTGGPTRASRTERARSPLFDEGHIAPAPSSASGLRYRRPGARSATAAPQAGQPLETALSYPREPTAPSWLAGGCAGGFSLLAFGFLFLGWRRSRARVAAAEAAAKNGAAPAPSAGPPPASGPCEVRRLSLAFDWTQRPMLQTALEQMAGRYDMASAEGMHRAARDARDLLLRAVEGAHYAAFQRYHLPADDAEGRFAQLATDLRARFAEETVNQAYRQHYGQMRPRREEGEGLVVVSLVVGAMTHLPALPGRLDREAVRHALSTSLPDRPADLVALEVIWSPSDDADRMSSAELEMFYPELQRLDDAGAVGRLSCSYCRAVYPGELGRCPGCGAPAPTSG